MHDQGMVAVYMDPLHSHTPKFKNDDKKKRAIVLIKNSIVPKED